MSPRQVGVALVGLLAACSDRGSAGQQAGAADLAAAPCVGPACLPAPPQDAAPDLSDVSDGAAAVTDLGSDPCAPIDSGGAPGPAGQMFVESFAGRVTRNEVDSFKSYLRTLTPAPDNMGNAWA